MDLWGGDMELPAMHDLTMSLPDGQQWHPLPLSDCMAVSTAYTPLRWVTQISEMGSKGLGPLWDHLQEKYK